MVNSNAVLVEKSIYSSESETENDGSWIQPSIIQQNIEIQSSGLINGIYVQNFPLNHVRILDQELAQEIDAWEAASSFDYWAFEDAQKNSK